MNSCTKGKVGEREWRDVLKAKGFEARRGRQFSGSPDSPDVVSNLPFHFEVKRVEALNINKAMEQAKRDCGKSVPVVAHRKNKCTWLVTMAAEDWLELVREKHADACSIAPVAGEIKKYYTSSNSEPLDRAGLL
jgi:Holliday junction resolvase